MKQTIKRLFYLYKNKGKNVSFGKNVNIGGFNSFFEGNNKINSNTFFAGSIGFGSYMGKDCNIKAKIGKYCSIGQGVSVVTGNHPTKDFVSTHPCFFSNKMQAGFTYCDSELFKENNYAEQKFPVVIGNDVWIGYGATILDGIKIGDGAVIAAGAVVTKNVEPYSIVGGVSAKEIRKRFSDEEIEFLLDLKWWDKDEAWVIKNAHKFTDIKNLMK